jgi:hypothetical protein
VDFPEVSSIGRLTSSFGRGCINKCQSAQTVGASFWVVTDPITSKRFSAVVPPNDALSLARAQVNVLALLDEGDRPKSPAQPTGEEEERITKRMYEKTEQRRRLGMLGRTNVLNSFSSERYLREDEQMLWIGKYRCSSYRSGVSTKISSSNGESTAEGGSSIHNRLWYNTAISGGSQGFKNN